MSIDFNGSTTDSFVCHKETQWKDWLNSEKAAKNSFKPLV
jgi:hypothetical protein